MNTRVVFSAAIAAAISLSIVPSAIATSVGTAPVGSTITATAWERGGLDNFNYALNDDDLQPLGGFEEYVYRLHSNGTNVDVQETTGYEGLTEAEQNQWYEDAGYAPYDFTWMAFMCLEDLDIVSDAPLVDAGISLTEMHYAAADILFPSADRDFWADYVPGLSTPLLDETFFGLDDFDITKASVTGYTATFVGVGEAFDDMVFSVSFPEFACPDGSSLEMFPIMDPANPDNYAIDRDLTVPETLTIDVYDNNREIASDGVYIGVTGIPVFSNFNAALWGMTQVDGKLAATGTDAVGLGLFGAGLAAVGVSAVVVRRVRQRV